MSVPHGLSMSRASVYMTDAYHVISPLVII
jgi:hypothetical protein